MSPEEQRNAQRDALGLIRAVSTDQDGALAAIDSMTPRELSLVALSLATIIMLAVSDSEITIDEYIARSLEGLEEHE